MKVLVFGPSGAGKTYISNALHSKGINAFDGDAIKGLSSWYDRQGKKVAAPLTADEALNSQYSFLWSRKFLKAFLDKFEAVYVFGGSGNIFNLLDLFDKTYFLKVQPEIQRQRILNMPRETPLMDSNEDGIVLWGEWLEAEAKKHEVDFINASLTPEEIFKVIR